MRVLLLLGLFLLTGGTSAQDNPIKKEMERQATAQVDRCRELFDKSVTLSKVKSMMDGCTFTSVSEKEIVLSRLRGMGINTPLYFENAQKAREEELKRYQREQGDSIVVTNNIVTFDKSDEKTIPLTNPGDTLGNEVVNLSGNVTEILLHLQTSESTKEFVEKEKASGKEGMTEVLELAWMWDHMIRPVSDCGGVRLENTSEEFRKIVWKTPGRVNAPAQVFFGIKDEADLDKLNAFKWEESGHIRYLFHAPGKTDSDDWVLAEFDKNTKAVRFTHYKITRASIPATKENGPDSSIAASVPLKMKIQGAAESVGMNGWVGASVRTNNTKTPWGSSVELPSNTIDLAKIEISQTGNEVRSSHVVTATSKNVTMANNFSPTNSTSWDMSTHASLKVGSKDWTAGGTVRVYNVMLGYETNRSNDSNVNMTVVKDKSYLKLDTGRDNKGRMTAGHMFDNHKGGIAYSFDAEKKSHRIEVVVIY